MAFSLLEPESLMLWKLDHVTNGRPDEKKDTCLSTKDLAEQVHLLLLWQKDLTWP